MVHVLLEFDPDWFSFCYILWACGLAVDLVTSSRLLSLCIFANLAAISTEHTVKPHRTVISLAKSPHKYSTVTLLVINMITLLLLLWEITTWKGLKFRWWTIPNFLTWALKEHVSQQSATHPSVSSWHLSGWALGNIEFNWARRDIVLYITTYHSPPFAFFRNCSVCWLDLRHQ